MQTQKGNVQETCGKVELKQSSLLSGRPLQRAIKEPSRRCAKASQVLVVESKPKKTCSPSLFVDQKQSLMKPSKKKKSFKMKPLTSQSDPYLFEDSDSSNNDKENVDPKLTKSFPLSKKADLADKLALKLSKSRCRTIKEKLKSRSHSTAVSQTRKQSVRIKEADKFEPPIRTLNTEQMRMAATTIHLPIPRNSFATGLPLISNTPLSNVHPTLSSTPVLVNQKNINTVNPSASLPRDTFAESPIVKSGAKSTSFPSEIVQSNAECQVEDLPATMISSLTTDTENRSASKDTSVGSVSSSGRRRHKETEKQKQEAYTSWLDEFNAQMKTYESHELSIIDDK